MSYLDALKRCNALQKNIVVIRNVEHAYLRSAETGLGLFYTVKGIDL